VSDNNRLKTPQKGEAATKCDFSFPENSIDAVSINFLSGFVQTMFFLASVDAQ